MQLARPRFRGICKVLAQGTWLWPWGSREKLSWAIVHKGRAAAGSPERMQEAAEPFSASPAGGKAKPTGQCHPGGFSPSCQSVSSQHFLCLSCPGTGLHAAPTAQPFPLQPESWVPAPGWGGCHGAMLCPHGTHATHQPSQLHLQPDTTPDLANISTGWMAKGCAHERHCCSLVHGKAKLFAACTEPRAACHVPGSSPPVLLSSSVLILVPCEC